MKSEQELQKMIESSSGVKERVSFYLERENKEYLKKLAKKNKISFSKICVFILKDSIIGFTKNEKKRGIYKV